MSCKRCCRHWDEKAEKWYFSVVDVIAALTDSVNSHDYWFNLKSIEIRKDLTNEWQERGVLTNKKFAILTDDITFAWAGLKTKDYKKHKDLKKEKSRKKARKSPAVPENKLKPRRERKLLVNIFLNQHRNRRD